MILRGHHGLVMCILHLNTYGDEEELRDEDEAESCLLQIRTICVISRVQPKYTSGGFNCGFSMYE